MCELLYFKLENSRKVLVCLKSTHPRFQKFDWHVARVRLEEYDKKQSTWNEKRSTMISKVAKVQALREAFPTQLGAMYTSEEQNTVDADYSVVDDKVRNEISKNANKETFTMNVEPEPVKQTPKATPAEAFEAPEAQSEMFADNQPKF